jgi:hypothetical protein
LPESGSARTRGRAYRNSVNPQPRKIVIPETAGKIPPSSEGIRAAENPRAESTSGSGEWGGRTRRHHL